MLTHKTKNLQIYFGDAQDGISKHLHCNPTNAKLVNIEPFKSIAQKIDVPRLSVLNQTHGIEGVHVRDVDFSFNIDGDYLISNKLNVGLGVITADCMPVILYDAKNNNIGIAHAGWRGAVDEIVPKMLQHMQSVCDSKPQNMQVYIGPSAKACCYEVQKDFEKQIRPSFADQVMILKDGRWYFDTVQLISLQMMQVGIDPASINNDFNLCTICDTRFCSYRRAAGQAGRQITVALLC